MYELLTGKLPYYGSTLEVLRQIADPKVVPAPPRALNSEVPPELEAICLKAMAKKRAERYASAEEMAEDLSSWLRDESVGALPDRGLRGAFRALRRNRRRVTTWGLVASLAMATALLAFSAFRTPPHEPARVTTVNRVGMQFLLIPAGRFTMGSPQHEAGHSELEGPQHDVVISKPFYMGRCEVTQREFLAFVEAARYETEAEKEIAAARSRGVTDELDGRYTWKQSQSLQANNHPVIHVSWNDAQAFCDWLTRSDRCTYRLPTEAEWEYACRAGTTTLYYWGDDPQTLAKVATFTERNPFGLCDMHGNVSEWCQDWLGNYTEGRQTDPCGPGQGEARVIRGGSWHDSPLYCRSAARRGLPPSARQSDLGFRVVRDLTVDD